MTESSRKIVEGQLQLQATDYGETSGERLQGTQLLRVNDSSGSVTAIQAKVAA